MPTDFPDVPLEVVETNDAGLVIGRAMISPPGPGAWLTLEVSASERHHRVGAALAAASLAEVRRHKIADVRIAFNRGDQAALALVHGCGCPVSTHAAGHSCIARIDTRPIGPA